MWRRRIALATVAAVVAAGAATPAAWAGYQDEPIYGDLNLDGLTDRVTLTTPASDACGVTVELGRPDGGYGTATPYTYPSPGLYCPDLGVIVDLGGDGVVELVLAWFYGAPPEYPDDLLVLRDFTPVAGFRAIFQPSYLGTADFNGDGRLDVYEWTDQGEGFVTLLNTTDGRLVPGPLHWCSPTVTPDFRLADFDGDGGTDMLVTYPEDCADASSGVAVLHGEDGSRVQLERDPEAFTLWAVQVVDANRDRRPDVRTVSDTGVVSHHISHRDGTFTRVPVANDDLGTVSRNRTTEVAVLANDVTTRAARITIVTPPRYGAARVTASGAIEYTPGRRRGAGDRLVYRLIADGRADDAAVTIRFR